MNEAAARTTATPNGGQPLLVTPREAARMLAICERTLWGSDIPRVRIGKRGVRYDVEDLRRFISEHKA